MDAVDPGIFEAWLASTDDGVVAVDAEGRVVLHNSAASRVTGLAPTAAHRRPWREVLRLDPPINDLLWTARTTKRSTTALATVLCAQGNVRTAEILAHHWTDMAGRSGILVLIRDLTALCRARTGPAGRAGYGGMVGGDPAMTAMFDLVEAVAPSDVPVVIEGEPGTGKEMVAQAIHARSRRSERPLIVVDCAAVPPGLLETELFGHFRAGAHGSTSVGRAELAHTGTLLLKRIEAAGAGIQQRLLRLLDTGVVERTGDATPRRVDVRMLASTSRSLDAEVREGRFQDELLRRLRVVRVRVPALRERRADVALLTEHFLARHGGSKVRITPEASAMLAAGEWPGNVRQLERLVRQLAARVASGGDPVIEPRDLPDVMLAGDATPRQPAHGSEDRRTVLLRALSSHGGNRTAAARALGIGRATFYRWWREAGLGGPEAPVH